MKTCLQCVTNRCAVRCQNQYPAPRSLCVCDHLALGGWAAGRGHANGGEAAGGESGVERDADPERALHAYHCGDVRLGHDAAPRHARRHLGAPASMQTHSFALLLNG